MQILLNGFEITRLLICLYVSMNLTNEKQNYIISSIFRNLDDSLNIDNVYFERIVHKMSPAEL